jgi:hypothetical protein
MTTTVAKLLEQKRQLVERLEHDPGPEEREQIERLLEQVNAALARWMRLGQAVATNPMLRDPYIRETFTVTCPTSGNWRVI